MKHLLPNCAGFGVLSLGYDLIAALFGMEKKHKELIIVKDGRVSEANKYLNKQYDRLIRAAEQDDRAKFEYLSDRMLRRSKLYQLVAMNRTLSGWFWRLKNCRIRATMIKLNKICEIRSSSLNYHRTYIPKGSNKYGRPLGVPTLEWRIWSWMNLNLMELWITHSGRKPTWQHGALSKRGCVTAWNQLITRLDKPYIYEFDIKGFFNHVSHDSIKRFMKKAGFRKGFIDWVEQTSKVPPKKVNLPPRSEEDPIILAKAFTLPPLPMLKIREFFNTPDKRGRLPFHWSASIDFTDDMERTRIRESSFDLNIPGQGLPQGLGTSPFLSCMALANEWGEEPGLIMYMDDGIIYADNEGELQHRISRLKEVLRKMSCEIAPEKSRIVKLHNQWLNSFKFLGLRYEPEKDHITSETRSGTKVSFPRIQYKENVAKLWWRGNSQTIEAKAIKEAFRTSTHVTAVRHSLLGLFMSHSYNPNANKGDIDINMKQMIREGQQRLKEAILNNRDTYYWDNQDIMPGTKEDPQFIFTCSTRVIRTVLEKGNLAKRAAKSADRKVLTVYQSLMKDMKWADKQIKKCQPVRVMQTYDFD